MIAILKRDLALSLRAGGGLLTGVLFFLAVIVVVPFSIGPDLNLLARLGPAVLWIGALLASLLELERLFQADREDGSLDQMMLMATPLPVLVFAKAVAHWLITGLPLVLAAPLFGLFLNMSSTAILATSATLLVGTPAITFIGAVGAAITVTLPRGGLLIAILALPLTIPVLVFGVSAAYGAVEDPAPFLPPFLILTTISLFFSVIGPFAAAFALKMRSG
ncbi:MAG: heme exporter protein CcmB [Pseudomonadota bacterium]